MLEKILLRNPLLRPGAIVHSWSTIVGDQSISSLWVGEVGIIRERASGKKSKRKERRGTNTSTCHMRASRYPALCCPVTEGIIRLEGLLVAGGSCGQAVTTRKSSLKKCRRNLEISTAIPLGSLILFWRSSLSTARKPSFHRCRSSAVLPGLEVPSSTRTFSP